MQNEILKILELLDGYIVGGYTRDRLLGDNIESKDIDIVTPYSMDEVRIILEKNFSDLKPLEINIVSAKFNILKFKLKGLSIEISRMRMDIGRAKNRLDQDIKFVNNIYEDLSRRDFTINAIAFDGSKYYCSRQGLDDINNKVLRFIGDSDERIKEDPLRMLRGIRFAVTKNLGFCSEILNSIKKNKNLIEKISSERIFQELKKMLVVNPKYTMEILSETELDELIFPEITILKKVVQNNKYHQGKTVYKHTLELLEKLNHKGDINIILAGLYHDTGKYKTKALKEDETESFYGHERISTEIFNSVKRKFQLKKESIDEIKILIKYHDSRFSGIKISNLLQKLGSIEILNKLLILMEADISNEGILEFKLFKTKIQKYFQELKTLSTKPVFTRKDLDITSEEIMEITGIKGEKMKEIYIYLMKKIAKEKMNNTRYDIIKNIERIEVKSD